MSDCLATDVAEFVAHKRALGRKYRTEEATLRLLLAFCDQHRVESLDQLTPSLTEEFIASRPRKRARSFNNLVGALGCFLDWAVTQQRLDASPLHRIRRRETDQRLPFIFDATHVRQLLEAAAALPDNPRAIGRGPIYHTIFALCYGLGLRAGEACGLLLGDVDLDRQLLVVRGGKFGKSRLVPHGPRIGELLIRQLERRRAQGAQEPDAPLFTFDGRHRGSGLVLTGGVRAGRSVRVRAGGYGRACPEASAEVRAVAWRCPPGVPTGVPVSAVVPRA